MRGRPKRATDTLLAARARGFEQREALSPRQASLRLGIEPSTYSRCMGANAFSKKTAAVLEQALDHEGVPRVGPDVPRMPPQAVMQLLRIFEEGAAILAPFRSTAVGGSAKSSKGSNE